MRPCIALPINHIKGLVTLLLLMALATANSQNVLSQKQKADSTIAERQKVLFDFLNIAAQDKIADIGTGSGFNLVPIANHYPTLLFTAEDIDSNYCNKELLQKRINGSGNKTKIENFNIHIGTETTTNLPAGSFTKVLAFDVIHEMTFKAEMLADIAKILQHNGTLYIQEILVHKKIKKEKACNYPYLTEDELKTLLQRNKCRIEKEIMFIDTGHNKYIKLFACSFLE